MKLGVAAVVLWCLCGASGTALAAQDCRINGLAVNPSDTSTTAGKSGLMRCIDRDTGKVVRESTMASGEELGLALGYHPDGSLRRAAFREEAGSERAAAEFTSRGQLSMLRCADKPLLAPAVDDAKLCGFGKTPSQVWLFDDNGILRSRVSYLNGKRIRAERLYDNGKPATQEEITGMQRIERNFSSEGVKRSEVVSTLQPRGGTVRLSEQAFSEKGTLVRDQRWDAAGEPLQDNIFYADGQPRSKTAFKTSGAGRVADVIEFHENGQRASQGRFTAPSRAPLLPVGTHLRFNDDGQVVTESTYDGKGRVTRERTWDDTGVLTRDDAISADGSRKGMAP